MQRRLPCRPCPDERFGPLAEADRATRLYFRVVHYLNAAPESMGGYPWELICAMAGITDLDTLREVWERLAIARQVQDEERQRDEQRRGSSNGHRDQSHREHQRS